MAQFSSIHSAVFQQPFPKPIISKHLAPRNDRFPLQCTKRELSLLTGPLNGGASECRRPWTCMTGHSGLERGTLQHMLDLYNLLFWLFLHIQYTLYCIHIRQNLRPSIYTKVISKGPGLQSDFVKPKLHRYRHYHKSVGKCSVTFFSILCALFLFFSFCRIKYECVIPTIYLLQMDSTSFYFTVSVKDKWRSWKCVFPKLNAVFRVLASI